MKKNESTQQRIEKFLRDNIESQEDMLDLIGEIANFSTTASDEFKRAIADAYSELSRNN